MHKQIEFCPNCNSRQEMDQTLGLMSFNSQEGVVDILLYNYHCASCNTYVRSTTMNHEQFIKPNDFLVFSIPEFVRS
jgi:hypothetical protein